MPDRLSKSARSALMARIKGKNTGTELRVFRLLRRHQVYFARHAAGLPGQPDVVFRRIRLAVFIDGDFWHGRGFNRWRKEVPAFWREKIRANIRRDRRNDRSLRKAGWKVLHLWSKSVDRRPDRAVARILSARKKLLHKRAVSGRKVA